MRIGIGDCEAATSVGKGIGVSKDAGSDGLRIGCGLDVNGSPTYLTSNSVALTQIVGSYGVTKGNGFVAEERSRVSRRSKDDVKRKSKQKIQNFQLY